MDCPKCQVTCYRNQKYDFIISIAYECDICHQLYWDISHIHWWELMILIGLLIGIVASI